MKKTVILAALIAAIAGTVLWTRSERDPGLISGRAPTLQEGRASTDSAPPHAAAASTEYALAQTNALGAPASTQAKPRLEITETEERVFKMYDEIASALSDDQKSCDNLGTALGNTVEAHAQDLHHWAQTQKERAPAELEADNHRLLQRAGDRMQRAQEVIRRAMGKCLQSETFQDALRNLSELGTPG